MPTLISINRVYLYGSVMRGDPLVGDIDLEIEASRGPAYANDLQAYLRGCLAFVRQFAPNYVPPVYMAESGKAMDHLIFGTRRAPILKGAMINGRNLSTIPAPCQLIYTIQNGIDLNAPFLKTHPDYDPAIETTHEVPHLASIEVPAFGVPEPVDARFIAKFHPSGRIAAHDFASPTSNLLARLLRVYERQSSTLKVHVSGDTLDPAFAKRSGLTDDLSPKGTIVLTAETDRSELRSFMKIERKVAMIDAMLTVDLKVGDLATLQRRRSDEAHANCLAVVAATIHMADRFHAVALNQAGNNYPIEATVTTASSVPDAIGPGFLAVVLARRFARRNHIANYGRAFGIPQRLPFIQQHRLHPPRHRFTILGRSLSLSHQSWRPDDHSCTLNAARPAQASSGSTWRNTDRATWTPG